MSGGPVNDPICPECGTPLLRTAPHGLCSRCLVLNALILEDNENERESSLPDLDGLKGAFPDFEVRRVVGRGGMGLVYEAWQESLGRVVALKLLPPDLLRSEDFFERFQREARVMAQMDHPNIARVYGTGLTDEGQAYIVMELISGEPISRFASTNKLGLRSRLDLFMQVCAGVQHAHQKGVIHRDLKPSNVLVGTVDGRPVPKIIDFGLAKPIENQDADEAQWLSARHALGTPAYMSPEHLSGADVDSRSDIYSLGVLLYELLAGRTHVDENLFDVETAKAVREIILTNLITKPSEVLAAKVSGPGEYLISPNDVRGDLDAIVLKALEKDPALRYQSASAMPEDLQRHLRDEPVTAVAPSRAYNFRKFVHRHRIGLSIGGTFVALILIGTGLVFRQSLLTRRAEAVANERLRQGERLIQFMLGDLRGKLETVGRLDIMEGTVQEIEKFYTEGPLAKIGPEGLFHRGLALRTLGQIRNTQGQADSARDHYQEAIRLLGAAVTSQPKNAAWTEELGQTWNNLAVFHHSREEVREATDAYQEALRLSDALLRMDSGYFAWLDFKASVLHNFASLLEMSGRLDQAEERYSEALRIWEPLQKKFGDKEEFLDHVSQLYQSLAFIQKRRGEVEQMKRSNAEALELRKRLVELDPKNMRGLDLLADIEQNIAEQHFEREEFGQAEGWINEYRPIREKLAAHDPGNAHWQQKLADAWRNAALLEDARGNLRAAADARGKALQICENKARQDSSSLGRARWIEELRSAADFFSQLARKESDKGRAAEAREYAQTAADLEGKIIGETGKGGPAR